ncbi:glycosyltransferase [Micrococcus endophyticus]|uniref:glycosyltransferase n=1 Tax=Micrococcus endophyticus TaxID=455343 RepID=UPI0035A8A1AF
MPQDTRAARRPHMAMLVGNHVVGDSRVEKAAVSAIRAGYRVTVVGVGHRSVFNLGRYGTVPILRVPVPFRRYAAWLTLHGGGPEAATDWSAVLDPEEAGRMTAWDREHAGGSGLPQALVRGLSPHSLPDRVRGRLGRAARTLDARGPGRTLRLPAAGRRRRAVANFEAARTGHWREVWPMIADYEDAFLRALIDLDPDVVHVHDRHPLPAAAAYDRYRAAHGLDPVPWVYDAHEWVPGQMMAGPVDHRIAWKAAEAELIHEADAVLAVTDELSGRMQDYHALPERPTTLVNGPWGTQVPMAPEERLPLRTELGLAEDVPLLVYVGRLAAQRGIFTIVEALPHLPGVHVAFVGSPDLAPRAALRDLAARLGVADRIHIVDYVPSASVTWYVASATAGLSPLLPTPAHESAVPTKLREYLLAGLPSVVSDLREQARFVRDQGIGTVAAPDDGKDLARAVRELLEGIEGFRAAAADPALLDRHRWEASERALHEVWGRLAPTSAEPMPVEIAPDPATEAPRAGLLVIGDDDAAGRLVRAWPADSGPAVVRAPRPAPEGRGIVEGGPAALWDALAEWVADDLAFEAFLSTGQGPATGRAEALPLHELISLRARGRRAGMLAGDRLLADVHTRLLAVPGHPWAELDSDARAALDRRIRRGARPFREALEAGVPVLSHRRLEAAAVPGVQWLPLPLVPGPEPAGVAAPRSVLVLPGDRTAAERAAVEELLDALRSRGVALEAPSGPRHRRRPDAFRGDVVLAPLHTGEPEAAALRALAAGSAVVAGPPAPATLTDLPAAPCTVAEDATLVDTVLGLLEEDPAAGRERRALAREHLNRVHSPQAVAARLLALLDPAPPQRPQG